MLRRSPKNTCGGEVRRILVKEKFLILIGVVENLGVHQGLDVALAFRVNQNIFYPLQNTFLKIFFKELIFAWNKVIFKRHNSNSPFLKSPHYFSRRSCFSLFLSKALTFFLSFSLSFSLSYPQVNKKDEKET